MGYLENRNNQEEYENHYANDINNFLNKLFNEYLVEKDRNLSKLNKNNKKFDEIERKIILLQNNLCYDDSIFNPNNSYEELEYRIKQLIEKKEALQVETNEIEERIKCITKKIDDIYIIIKNRESYNNNSVSDFQEPEVYKIDILRSQELERKRIARDLHDSIIQNLTNLIHKTEFTLKVMDVDNIRAKLEIMTVSNNVRDIIDEMRNIIYNLRPMSFDDIGIDVIIDRELSKVREKGIEVKCDIVGECGKVDQVVLLTLVRIVQEACNNVIKHANATKIDLNILYDENYIEISIIDNGEGFEISNNTNIIYESKSGFGLSMMKERVYLLSGIIKFKSGINEGTQIYVKVPKCFREDIKNANKYCDS